MENTIQIINQLKEEKLIIDYAIGGAIASMFYIEASATFDLDIFIKIDTEENKLISLSPIYDWLKEKGYFFEKEHAIIEGVPVQFIPAYNELTEDALLYSIETKYGNTSTKVISKEYLIAIMIDTFRTKDKERALKFIEANQINKEILKTILAKHDLLTKYNNLIG